MTRYVFSMGLILLALAGCTSAKDKARSDGGTEMRDSGGGAGREAGTLDPSDGGEAARDGSLPSDASADSGKMDDAGQDAGPLPEGIAPTKVGSAGAMLSSDALSVTVPEGALSSDVELAFTPLRATELAKLAAPILDGVFDGTAELTSATYAFTPHGTEFSAPVKIEIRYDGEADRLLRLDDENDTTWEDVYGAVFADGVVSFDVYSFSVYAVIKTPPCNPCGTEAVGRECGYYYSDTCRRVVNLEVECKRAGCDTTTQGCSYDNECYSCVPKFDCADHEAACGLGYDNCNNAHDLAIECPQLGSCKSGTCFVDNEGVEACGQRCTKSEQCPDDYEDTCEDASTLNAAWGSCYAGRCTGIGDQFACSTQSNPGYVCSNGACVPP